jgi:hypothetical protein
MPNKGRVPPFASSPKVPDRQADAGTGTFLLLDAVPPFLHTMARNTRSDP